MEQTKTIRKRFDQGAVITEGLNETAHSHTRDSINPINVIKKAEDFFLNLIIQTRAESTRSVENNEDTL